MKRPALVAVGVLFVLIGIVWTLQGLGKIAGSVMTGVTIWAVIGPIVALVGIALAYRGVKGRGTPTP